MPGLRESNARQVLDRHRLDRVGGPKAKDAAVEIELGVERALDVLRLAEAVLFALEGEVGYGHALAAQGIDHRLGLVRWHDLVIEALKEDDRPRKLIDVMDWRTLAVE